MPDLIREQHPTARKEHKCMFCGCKIEVGEQYQRHTLKYEDTIYDWVCHDACNELTDMLDMYNLCDEGIGQGDFQDAVQEYLMENYHDEKLDDVREGVDGLFLAGVYSPKYTNAGEHPMHHLHSVIIDKDCNIVFDPQKEYEGLLEYPYSRIIGYNGIRDVMVITKLKEEKK